MRYRQLGRTDIKVSVICLGTMTYGEQNTEAEGHQQMDFAVSKGVNFFDTAEMYSIPTRAETYGETERIIGTWFKKSGKRSDIVLATKVVGPGTHDYIRDGKPKLDEKNITAAVDSSLKRLQTDYIDLYQLHWPERKTNFFGRLGYEYNDHQDVRIEETLEALDKCIHAGKVRHIGLSNETPWGVAEFLRLSAKNNWPRVVTVQNPYSLLNRTFEVGLAEFAHREQVGLMAYSPLGFGVLSGKYLNNQWPDGARLTLYKQFPRYLVERGVTATQSYIDLAKKHNLRPTQLALAYVNSRPFVTGNIIGATTLEQLEENISSVDVELSDDVIEGIEEIHKSNPNPCP